MKSSRFLLGITFLLLGLMWLGIEFGYISPVSWARLAQFWPVVIILAGLKIIFKNNLPYLALGTITILLVFIYSAFSPVSIAEYFGANKERSRQTANISRNVLDKKLILSLDAGAVEIETSSLDEAESKNTILSLEAEGMESLKTEKTVSDGTATVRISEIFEGRVFLGDVRRTLHLKIARNIPVEIVYSAGATKSNMDFTDVSLTSLTSKSGATTSEIRLGKNMPNVNLSIQSGASEYTVFVPEDTGYRIVSRSGLSSISHPGERDVVAGEDTKQSPSYDLADKKVNITLESGLTSLKLVRY